MQSDFQNYLQLYSKIRGIDPLQVKDLLQLDYQFAHNEEFWNYSETNKIHLSAFTQTSASHDHQKICLFGFWETIDDFELNQRVFDDLKQWARKRECKILIGPINGSTYRPYRIKIDSFDQRPYAGEPWTPPYYQNILNQLKMEPDQTYTSYLVDDSERLRDWLFKNPMSLATNALTKDLNFASLDQIDWNHLLPTLQKGAGDIFGDNYIYSPLDQDEFNLRYGEGLRNIICVKSSRLILDKKQKPVGAGLCFADPLAPAERPRLLIRTLGVLREHRKFGATYLRLIHEMARDSLDHYQEFMFCLMKKGNLPDLMGKGLAHTQFHYQLVKLTL